MSVENHRHCQATVLGATGEPPENGITWGTIASLDLPNLEADWIEYFKNNKNVTEDLAGILKLLNAIVVKINSLGAGDLISIQNNKVSVKNYIGRDYSGVVGITSGSNRQLTSCPISIVNEDPDGPQISTLQVGESQHPIRTKVEVENLYPNGTVIAKLKVGDQVFDIRTTDSQPVPVEERYVITEDEVYDIVLSGGDNDGDPLDYNDDETRYVVTENGHAYDIGVSGYGDNMILNYNED